ncbi:MAG: response regulator transcription factor [Chloroflexi bacterium]|nr:response regulator transcription factor [Chloroflexota bacterium]
MTSLPQTRVLLVDDHTILRSGLRMLLDNQAQVKVVGEAGNGREALQLAQSLQPDLILLDLSMPGLNGIEALPVLRKLAPAARILILTMHDDEGYLRQALQKGASGYVLKKAADSELLNAVQAVMRGEVYIHPAMTRGLLGGLIADEAVETPADENAGPWGSLSDREYEVLRLVARGHTNAEIAERLIISIKTVETYRARGMEKLGLRTRAQLVQAAVAKGLLD